MADRRYRIDVVVVSMLEAGLYEPTRIAEIRERYKELGYRPLTTRRAAELRLQFSHQPTIESFHKMGRFFILLEDNANRPDVEVKVPYIYTLSHRGADGLKKLYRRHCGREGSIRFNPYKENFLQYTGYEQATRFAVVAAEYPAPAQYKVTPLSRPK